MGDPLPMVSSSTGAMNSLLRKLTAMEDEHPQLAEGVRERLKTLNHALHRFARRRARDALTNEWMLQVREVGYDMEDWLDGCLIGPSKLDTELWCSDVSEQIEEFEAQIQDADERSTRYGLPISTEPTSAQDDDGGDGEPAGNVAGVNPDLLHGEAPCVVAIREPMGVLVSHLTDAEQRRKAVCILGAGGVGKTALATEVYRQLQLQGRFSCGAFVHLGRNPSVKTTLISILKQVMPDWHYEKDLWSGYNYDDMGAWDEKNVVAKLWAFLKTKSYFVVLDDVWSIRTWKVISCALPNNDNAADRILITTCKKDVKESCCIHPTDAVYQMEGLGENSKILFDSKIPSSEKHSQLEGSEEMLKMCGGMPLAITITAGLLLRKSACLPLDQYHSEQGMRKILKISYDDLTLPVKSCFLYLSAFPENYTIKKDRLIRRWCAERFIPKRNEESLWVTGESYFNELISRRLIQPAFDDDDHHPTGCTIHDDVFDFIKSLSSEENFVTAGAKLKSGLFPCDRVRRVCLDCDEDDEGDTLFSSTYCSLEQNNWVDSSDDEENSCSDKDEATSLHLSQVRSLAFYGDVRRIPDLSIFKFVRVLDLTDGKGLENEQLSSIGRLSLLRYLGLGGTKVTKLPQQIMKLDHLSTLDLRQTKVEKLPESEGSKLVSLLANGLTIPRGIGGMEKLEELSTVCLRGNYLFHEDMIGLVHRLRGLRMLGVKFSNITEEEEVGLKYFLDELGRSNLQFLFLDEYPHHLLGLLLDDWTHIRSGCLQKFELRMDWLHFFRYPERVPQTISFLEDLTHLHIGVLEVEAQGVRALGSLPKLVVLKLYSYNSPRFSVSSKDGFQCLTVFWYCCEHGTASGLQFEAGAMPHLRRLLLDLNASATDFVSGIWHLSCLIQVRATIYCGSTSTASALEDSIRDQVSENPSALEASIRDQVSENPNKPLLELNRKRKGRLLPRPEPPPDESVVEIQDEEEWYDQIDEANRTNKLVVVEFTATWCGPSRFIAPVFADLASKFPDVVFLKVDIDKMGPLSEGFGVTGAPEFYFMRGGEVTGRVDGAKEEELKTKLMEQMDHQ